nr:hypothetical protein Q903MT_gene1659 [Picea sitchensis]
MARNNYVFQPPHLDPSKVMAGKAHLLLSPAGPMLLMDQQLTLYLDQMELKTLLCKSPTEFPVLSIKVDQAHSLMIISLLD